MGTALAPAALRAGLPPSIEAAIDRLAARREAWVALGPADRARLLRSCLQRVGDTAQEWVRLGCLAKGLDPDAPLAGEEWLTGPMTTARQLRLYAETLEAGGVADVRPVRRTSTGELAVSVFPRSVYDRLLFMGMHAEIRLQPGKPPTRGSLYENKASGKMGSGGIALVLGAGNVSAIAPLDAITMLVVQDLVVLLKLNPVNAYLLPVFEQVFQPLIADGYLAMVTGGPETGALLSRHARVDRIHVTGSHRTYDAIMWGDTRAEQVRRKAAADPVVTVPVTAELGCVTPVLVVPGRWSDGDLEFQARHVAAMVAHNASFNCVAAKVLVLAAGWPQRTAFLDRVTAALARTASRRAYYPGAADRFASFVQRYPQARVLGAAGAGIVPWTLVPDVAAAAGENALTEEAFCGVLATVEVDAVDAPSFLERAVPLANDVIWGTLSCVVLVHPRTERAHRHALDRALGGLRYGAIGVNVWSGVIFSLGVTTWGAYPGHTPVDIRSGCGVVHNTLLFDHPQKSILWAPFRIRPTPAWFPDHRTLADVGRRLTAFEVAPSPLKLPGIMAAAVRG